MLINLPRTEICVVPFRPPRWSGHGSFHRHLEHRHTVVNASTHRTEANKHSLQHSQTACKRIRSLSDGHHEENASPDSVELQPSRCWQDVAESQQGPGQAQDAWGEPAVAEAPLSSSSAVPPPSSDCGSPAATIISRYWRLWHILKALAITNAPCTEFIACCCLLWQ